MKIGGKRKRIRRNIFLGKSVLLYLFLQFVFDVVLLILRTQLQAHAVHPHYYSHIFYVMQADDFFFPESWQNLSNSLHEEKFAFLITISDNETVYMNFGHFLNPHLLTIVLKNI